MALQHHCPSMGRGFLQERLCVGLRGCFQAGTSAATVTLPYGKALSIWEAEEHLHPCPS